MQGKRDRHRKRPEATSAYVQCGLDGFIGNPKFSGLSFSPKCLWLWLGTWLCNFCSELWTEHALPLLYTQYVVQLQRPSARLSLQFQVRFSFWGGLCCRQNEKGRVSEQRLGSDWTKPKFFYAYLYMSWLWHCYSTPRSVWRCSNDRLRALLVCCLAVIADIMLPLVRFRTVTVH
jgi:hypothetical protein